jgi:hypothetical protein
MLFISKRRALPAGSLVDKRRELSRGGGLIGHRQDPTVKTAQHFVLFETVDKNVNQSSVFARCVGRHTAQSTPYAEPRNHLRRHSTGVTVYSSSAPVGSLDP